jgi:hypothetical protein
MTVVPSQLPEFRSSKPIEDLEQSEIVEWGVDAIIDLIDAVQQSDGAIDARLIFARVASIVSVVAHSKPQCNLEHARDVVRALVIQKFRRSRHV